MNNPTTFTFGVVTGHGTTYLLMIENEQQFRAFGAAIFSGFSNQGTAEQDLSTIFEMIYGINKNADATHNEVAFLNYLRAMQPTTGLSLYKGNISTFSTWDKQGLNSNRTETITINCN